jgi:Ca2+-binding RTX toxin-like protein
VIRGEAGTDQIYGGRGADSIGEAGRSDTIYGGAGSDQINGEGGQNVVFGGDGGDNITTGLQDTRTYGQRGRDVILGIGGSELVDGGPGSDRCLDSRDGSGDDILRGAEVGIEETTVRGRRRARACSIRTTVKAKSESEGFVHRSVAEDPLR